MIRLFQLTAILTLLLVSGVAFAGQLSSDFRGRVVDAQGQPVVGAQAPGDRYVMR